MIIVGPGETAHLHILISILAVHIWLKTLFNLEQFILSPDEKCTHINSFLLSTWKYLLLAIDVWVQRHLRRKDKNVRPAKTQTSLRINAFWFYYIKMGFKEIKII